MSLEPPLPGSIDIDGLAEKPWRKPEVDLTLCTSQESCSLLYELSANSNMGPRRRPGGTPHTPRRGGWSTTTFHAVLPSTSVALAAISSARARLARASASGDARHSLDQKAIRLRRVEPWSYGA